MSRPMIGRAVQEMPPPGGYKPFNVARDVPASKVPGTFIFGACALSVVVGLYMVGQQNKRRRAVKMELRERRACIIPFLQAEEDVRYLREHAKILDQERRLMKDVPGWKVGESVYLTKDWMPPSNQRWF